MKEILQPFKIILFPILVIPALMVNAVIWVLGGWTKGQAMPNAVWALRDWCDEEYERDEEFA